MAILKVLQHPHPSLATKALPVTVFDAALATLANDMIATMYDDQGVGLAANQIGVLSRIFVMDVSEAQDEPIVLVNPEITLAEGEEESDEGCLSVKGVFAKVKRAATVSVRYHDVTGQLQMLELTSGLMSKCIQHEIDHLDGKLFIDRLSGLKRERILKKFAKLQEPNNHL